MGHPALGFWRVASETENDKDRPKPRLIGKEVFPLPSEQRRSERVNTETPETPKGETTKGAQ
jgi:hypothetical protein